MLVLIRQRGEVIQIGKDITIKILQILDKKKKVRIGIQAPDSLTIIQVKESGELKNTVALKHKAKIFFKRTRAICKL